MDRMSINLRQRGVIRGLIFGAVAMTAVAQAVSTRPAHSQTFNWTGNSNSNWKNVGNWSPTTGGPPNAVDAVAIFNLGSTGITSNVNLNDTVGSIIVNQPDAGAANLTLKSGAGDVLTFQTSTGDASFTNQLATGAVNDGTATVTVSADLQLNSPLDVYSNFDQASNTAITFSGVISGSQPITVYGGGNVQISTAVTGFTGPIIVNNGALRISNDSLTSAGNVTVNNGGQFQFGSSTVTDWSLGPGAAIYLNGAGKVSGVNNVGALRFQNNAVATNWDTPIVLQTDSTIYINGNLDGVPPTVGTVTTTQPITGAGALTKAGTGVLVLATDNTYGTASATQVNGGTLVLQDNYNDGGYAIPGDVTVGTVTNTNPTVLQINAASQQLPATANVTLVASTATPGVTGTFNLNGYNQTIGSLNGAAGGGLVQNNSTAGNSVLTINGTTVASNFSGVIQDGTADGTGTLALAYNGPQPLTLSGANTYSGGTTVSGATLFANNSAGSATGTGALTISHGTLAGSGIISGPVALVASTLAPSLGLSTPQTLSLGSTTFDSASFASFQLGLAGTTGGGVNDFAAITGDLVLAGKLNVTALSGFGNGVYELFSYTGNLVDNGFSLGALPSGFTYSIDESKPGEVDLKVSGGSSALLGDVNHDNVVNGLDISLVVSHWLQSGVGVAGDANNDHVVNGLDISLIASHWLQTGGGGNGLALPSGNSSTAAVPEPSSLLLLTMGLAVCVVRRWRR